MGLIGVQALRGSRSPQPYVFGSCFESRVARTFSLPGVELHQLCAFDQHGSGHAGALAVTASFIF